MLLVRFSLRNYSTIYLCQKFTENHRHYANTQEKRLHCNEYTGMVSAIHGIFDKVCPIFNENNHFISHISGSSSENFFSAKKFVKSIIAVSFKLGSLQIFRGNGIVKWRKIFNWPELVTNIMIIAK